MHAGWSAFRWHTSGCPLAVAITAGTASTAGTAATGAHRRRCRGTVPACLSMFGAATAATAATTAAAATAATTATTSVGLSNCLCDGRAITSTALDQASLTRNQSRILAPRPKPIARKLSAVNITVPVSSTPRHIAISKIVVLQNKLRMQTLTVPSIQATESTTQLLGRIDPERGYNWTDKE